MCPKSDTSWVGTRTAWGSFALSWEPSEQLVVWLPWQFSRARKQYSCSTQVCFWQLTLGQVVAALLFLSFFSIFSGCASLLKYIQGQMSNKGKTMKGVRTVGKGTTGVGSCERGGRYHRKKRPQVLPCTKDGALFVPGEDFLSQRLAAEQHRSRFLPPSFSASACLSLSLTCFSSVSAWKAGGGGESSTEERGRTRRGAMSL